MTVTATIRDECRHPLDDGGLIPGTSARPVPGLGIEGLSMAGCATRGELFSGRREPMQ